MASPEIAQQRALLDRIAELAGTDLGRSWAAVDTRADLDILRPGLAALLERLVALYGEAAAGVAADFYETARDASPARGRFSPRLPEVLSDEVRSSLMGTVVVSLRGVLSGDPDMTRRDLNGALDLHIKGAYRRTIADAAASDPADAGWQRMPSGGECDFCQEAAGTSSDRYHAHCRCMSMPIWLRR